MDVVGGYPSAPASRALEIRLLGRWDVRRMDGSAVTEREWRTGKNADLVRILAVNAGRTVAVKTVLEALWPDSDDRRAQASLRTAVSLARAVVGHEHLERTDAGLRLRGVWVDVVAFRHLAAQAHHALRAGDHPIAAMLVRDADDLYLGELRAHDEGADWLAGERQRLAGEYLALLCDGAEAAIADDNGGEAVQFARRALAADPFSERGSRLLMLALRASGELPLAVQEYERCRRLLADELGIDPSPQTQAVYLELLRGDPADLPSGQSPVDAGSLVLVGGDAAQGSEALADAFLQSAMAKRLPARDFERSRREALAVAELPLRPSTRIRALTIAALPDALLGRPRAAEPILERAADLGDVADHDPFRTRLDVLSCLVEHDTDTAGFAGWWSSAAAWTQTDLDINWMWLSLRIAAERHDYDTMRTCLGQPVAPSAGPLARRIYALSAAMAMAELGDSAGAVAGLRDVVVAEQRACSTLLLPEALARLVLLQAHTNPVEAHRDAAWLDRILEQSPPLPREWCLRLLARAELESSRGRLASACADAATAVQVAQDNGLRILETIAHGHWLRHFESARVWSARELPASLPRLRLAMSSFDRPAETPLRLAH